MALSDARRSRRPLGAGAALVPAAMLLLVATLADRNRSREVYRPLARGCTSPPWPAWLPARLAAADPSAQLTPPTQ